MLLRHLKKQHARMICGLRRMKPFALTKMYINQYHDHPVNQIGCLWFQGKERC